HGRRSRPSPRTLSSGGSRRAYVFPLPRRETMDRPYWAAPFLSHRFDFATAVRDLEARGIAGLEVPQIYGPPFVPLAAAALVTTRLQLASGIAIGLTRSP